jgi:riboflavin transporter 2
MPFSILFSICAYEISTARILLEFLVGVILSSYIIAIAVMSPCPILVNYRIGAIIIVIFWIAITSIFIRIRCCIATRLQECGQNILYIFGTLTIIGQFFGGILAFLIVDVYRLLKDLAPCQRIEDVCYLK